VPPNDKDPGLWLRVSVGFRPRSQEHWLPQVLAGLPQYSNPGAGVGLRWCRSTDGLASRWCLDEAVSFSRVWYLYRRTVELHLSADRLYTLP
jgi:hypothetical protein